MRSRVYKRPYRPITLTPGRIEPAFPLRRMAEQLMREETFVATGRDALTLVHSEQLTAVLTVARRGTTCDAHRLPGPTIIVAITGTLTIAPGAGGHAVRIAEGDAVGLGSGIDHTVKARRDCAFLTLIGAHDAPRSAGAMHRTPHRATASSGCPPPAGTPASPPPRSGA